MTTTLDESEVVTAAPQEQESLLSQFDETARRLLTDIDRAEEILTGNDEDILYSSIVSSEDVDVNIEKDEKLSNKIHRFGSPHQDLDDTFSISADYNDVDAASQELEQKSIFLSTIHAANSELVNNVTRYDHVIIDEASQINIPMSFIPFSLSNNISLVGDHFQLPPIFSEEVVDQNNDKKSFKSIFETLWENSEGIIKDDDRNYLRHQYRMAEEIISYP